jgi:predicted  nucleic acid-binding Zn-ribbon protein
VPEIAAARKKADVTLGPMPTDVDADALERLLQVQAEDSEIRRLLERKASLPEAARLADVTDQLNELDADVAIAQKQHDEVVREQNRLEGEIDSLTSKAAREEQRLFSGGVSNPKELSSLQAEIEMLKRRSASLEDVLLEAMVQRDGIETTLASLRGERSGAVAEAEELSNRVGELTREIDEALAQHRARREAVAQTLPDDLLATYERLRDAKNGVGAAALVGDTCQGCHTKLPAREVERVRAERGLQRCDNCRRILVVV